MLSPSAPQLASIVPSGENAALRTGRVCPLSKVDFGACVSIVEPGMPMLLATASRAPSGEYAISAGYPALAESYFCAVGQSPAGIVLGKASL